MKAINQVMGENNFLVVDNVEDARTLAKDVRNREKHCASIIELDDGKFTVWPESYALKAGIEPVETFHLEEEVSTESLGSLLETMFGGKGAEKRQQEERDLMQFAIGCLLIRNGGEPLVFSDEELDYMSNTTSGFGIEARQDGFTVSLIKKGEIH